MNIALMENKLIEKTLKFWSNKISYAEYDSAGKTFKVPLTKNEVDLENNQLIIDFNINDEITEDATITEVRWFDDNGECLDSSTENILREFGVEGILYRYFLSLRKED